VDLFPQLLGIIAVFGLLAFALWFLKKKGAIRRVAFLPFRFSVRRPRGDERLLERIDGLQLSATHSLSLVRMNDRAILIGVSPNGFCLVDNSPWKPVPPGAAQPLAGSDAFAQTVAEREQAGR
jgi:flagellar biogenesis protein FliO